jgi:hypothetical protein
MGLLKRIWWPLSWCLLSFVQVVLGSHDKEWLTALQAFNCVGWGVCLGQALSEEVKARAH